MPHATLWRCYVACLGWSSDGPISLFRQNHKSYNMKPVRSQHVCVAPGHSCTCWWYQGSGSMSRCHQVCLTHTPQETVSQQWSGISPKHPHLNSWQWHHLPTLSRDALKPMPSLHQVSSYCPSRHQSNNDDWWQLCDSVLVVYKFQLHENKRIQQVWWFALCAQSDCIETKIM